MIQNRGESLKTVVTNEALLGELQHAAAYQIITPDGQGGFSTTERPAGPPLAVLGIVSQPDSVDITTQPRRAPNKLSLYLASAAPLEYPDSFARKRADLQALAEERQTDMRKYLTQTVLQLAARPHNIAVGRTRHGAWMYEPRPRIIGGLVLLGEDTPEQAVPFIHRNLLSDVTNTYRSINARSARTDLGREVHAIITSQQLAHEVTTVAAMAIAESLTANDSQALAPANVFESSPSHVVQ